MLLACQAICARFCMTSSKRCTSVSRRDILDCSRTQYTTYAEFFRGNRRRIRLCNCLLTRCACSRATAVIQKAWSKHMKFFWRIHTAHVRLERVVLTREANVWKRRSFDYHTTGQTAAHFRQATCWARNSHPLVCFCATLDYHAQIAQCAPPNLSMPSEIIL